MGIDRSRRVTFEEHAEIYDQVSPKYPEELVADILAFAAMPKGGRILEIGPGPGNATLPFARQGYGILGIELGRKLTAIARERCRLIPGVKIINCAFEDWQVEQEAFDLAISADAFHWIPPSIGYLRVAQALKDTGAIALYWNVPVDPNTDWSKALGAVYQDMGPEVVNPATSWKFDWVKGIIEENFASSGCFGEVTINQYAWFETVTKEIYLKSLKTYSSHRDLEQEVRRTLYAGVGKVFDQFGGKVEQPRRVALFLARKKRDVS